MLERLREAKSKGCEAIEMDNIDCYQRGGGYVLSARVDALYHVLNHVWVLKQPRQNK
jgi:hypothetical protein